MQHPGQHAAAEVDREEDQGEDRSGQTRVLAGGQADDQDGELAGDRQIGRDEHGQGDCQEDQVEVTECARHPRWTGPVRGSV